MNSIFYMIFVIGLLVFVHELGHFLVAKSRKVRVEKFSLGFGPEIIGRKIGETRYCLSIIPLGGYVKMAGENIEDERKGEPYEYLSKSVKERIAIVGAGPVMNILLCVVIFAVLFTAGVPYLPGRVGTVLENSPAEEAGLKTGDKILEIDNKIIEDWTALTEIIHKSAGKSVRLTVEREEKKFEIEVVPKLDEDNKIGLIGITPYHSGKDINEFPKKKYSPVVSLGKAFNRTFYLVRIIYEGLWKLITGQVSAKHLGGPILIAQMAGQQAQAGMSNLFMFIAVISVNLAVLNFLPIPVLDGGHILFLSIEGIRGKPVSKKKQEIAQQVGITILICLMLLATYNDILRFFTK